MGDRPRFPFACECGAEIAVRPPPAAAGYAMTGTTLADMERGIEQVRELVAEIRARRD